MLAEAARRRVHRWARVNFKGALAFNSKVAETLSLKGMVVFGKMLAVARRLGAPAASRLGCAVVGAGCAAVGVLGWSDPAAAAAATGQRLFVWGEAGVARESLPAQPLELTALGDAGTAAREVVFGAGFVAALDTKGALWLWFGTQGAARPDGPGPWRVRLPDGGVALAAMSDELVVVTAGGRALLLAEVGAWAAALRETPAGALVAPPTALRTLRGDAARRTIVGAAAGGAHALLWASDGRLLALGEDGRGQLGLGGESRAARTEPALVAGALADAHVVHATCGARHSLALTRDGRAFAWGDDKWLQLGVRDGSVASLKTKIEMVGTPTQLDLPAQLRAAGCSSRLAREPTRWRVSHAAAGGAHTLVCFREEGSGKTAVVVCGRGQLGQLGDGQFRHISPPLELKSIGGREEWDDALGARVPISVRALAAGEEHSAALLTSGDVLVWGANGLSQQGTGNRVGQPAPARVRALTGTRVDRIACARHSCAAWTQELKAARAAGWW
jgi:hypothetical protein